jgi:hypothetical protein
MNTPEKIANQQITNLQIWCLQVTHYASRTTIFNTCARKGIGGVL